MTQLMNVTIEDQIAVIALNQYKKRNALSTALITEFIAILDDLQNQKVRVIIIRQEGKNAVWSAGHDISELPVANQNPLPYNDPLEKLLRAVRQCSIPIIAMIHGSVWGGALDLVINCDMVIADDTAFFAITPAKLGLPYNASGIQHFLARLPVNIVNELFFTAEPIQAKRAHQFHLVNYVLSEDELEAFTMKMANTISSRSQQSITAFKKQVNLLISSGALSPQAYEYIEQIRHDVYCGKDYNEGVNAFLEKRKPNFSD